MTGFKTAVAFALILAFAAASLRTDDFVEEDISEAIGTDVSDDDMDAINGGVTSPYNDNADSDGAGYNDPTVAPAAKKQSDSAIHEEARSHVEGLLQAGKTKDACKSLADSGIKAIDDSVKNAQKIMDAVPKGASCKKEGQPEVDAATKAHNAATTKLKDAKAASSKAKAHPVKFKDVTIAEIKAGDCSAFFTDPSYTAAKKSAETAGNKMAKVEGEEKAAKKALDDAIAAQKYAEHVCSCKVQREHAKAKQAADKANSAENDKAWKKSHMMKCVLAGTSMSSCKVPATPTVKVPALQAPAKGASCGAKNFKVTAAHTSCQYARGQKLEYLDRQHLTAYPGGDSLKGFQFTGSGCSGNNMRYAQWSIATPKPQLSAQKKETKCTPFVGKQVEYLDRQWPNCGNSGTITDFKVTGCGGGNKRYTYKCNQFNPKYVGKRVWHHTNCGLARHQDLQYLDRQYVQCPSNTALSEFGLTGQGCGGNNMRYSYACLELNY